MAAELVAWRSSNVIVGDGVSFGVFDVSMVMATCFQTPMVWDCWSICVRVQRGNWDGLG